MTVWTAMTVLPLLVVCLNVSGMVQVRSAMRERELSIRQAIGASRKRLIQHLLAEAIVLAALGGTLASLLLFNVPSLVAWWIGEPIPRELEQALRRRRPDDRGQRRTLSGDEPGVWLAAGGPVQPTQDHDGAQGRNRRRRDQGGPRSSRDHGVAGRDRGAAC